MTSPLPNDPDVHLSVFLHGIRLNFPPASLPR